MEDEDDGIHPLDRDYTQPAPTRVKKKLSGDAKLVRVGAFGFGLGFLILLGAAIVLVNSPSGGPLETLGAFLHRFGMVIILVAGLTVIAAYRLPGLRSKIVSRESNFRWNPGVCYRALVLWNVAFFILIAFGAFASQLGFLRAGFGVLISGMITITAALMVTQIVWHRGFIRAFAIGVFVGLVFSAISAGFLIASWGMYGRSSSLAPVLIHLAIIQISGLVCAGYVRVLEGMRERDAEKS